LGCLLLTSTSPAAIYSLSLHDALPILQHRGVMLAAELTANLRQRGRGELLHDVHGHLPRKSDRARIAAYLEVLLAQIEVFAHALDRKSTRLNSSHEWISYAVFCLKKKK